MGVYRLYVMLQLTFLLIRIAHELSITAEKLKTIRHTIRDLDKYFNLLTPITIGKANEYKSRFSKIK